MTEQERWDKKVRSLLKDADGREALKRFGIDVEIIGQEGAQDDKPIVAILCPTYRTPEPQMKDALAKMCQATAPHATVYLGSTLSNSVVHWSRNSLVMEQLKSGKPWTHILFIDDDMVVEPDSLLRLLSHGKDIIAGFATRRQDPPIPNVRVLVPDTKRYEQLYEWPENGLIGGLDIGVGTGLMLISRHAMEQVAQAYFDCMYEQERWGLSGERLEAEKKIRLDAFDKEKLCYWFDFLRPMNLPVQMGEDISFCFLATRYCKIPVYVDTAVQPGHIGNYAFSVKDFLPYRDLCIQRAKSQGNYHEAKVEGKAEPSHSFRMTFETPEQELVTQ